jgi:PPOX class probable F420-dependent enzyme
MGVPLPDAVRALFEGRNWGHLATIMKDGSPQVTPVWVDVDDQGRILVNTAEGRTKPRNVRRDPRVAISITRQEQPSAAAFVRGRVVELRHEGAWDHYDKRAHKYNGRPPAVSPDAEQRVILVIEPEHVTTHRLD